MTHVSYMEFFQFRSQPFSEHTARESLWQDDRMAEGLALFKSGCMMTERVMLSDLAAEAPCYVER